jgi:hypothetical protein
MFLSEIHICICLWGKWRNEKYILNVSLKFVEVGSYDFPYPCDGLFKRPLVDTEFDLE